MDMIIAETGGSKATLYKHFPTKDDLVTGLMERVADTVSADMEDPASSTMPVAEELKTIARSACHGVWSPGAAAVLRLCLGEYGRFPDLAHTVWHHGPARTYANFRAFLVERHRRGELVVDDPQIAAEQFLSGLVGHLQLKIAFGMTESPTPQWSTLASTLPFEPFSPDTPHRRTEARSPRTRSWILAHERPVQVRQVQRSVHRPQRRAVDARLERIVRQMSSRVGER